MISLLIRLTQFSSSTHWLDRFTAGFELIAQLKIINEQQLFFFEISVSLSHKAAVWIQKTWNVVNKSYWLL